MRGNEIFKLAVRAMAQSAREALAKAGLATKDLRAVIPHQANYRIVTATQEVLGLTDAQTFINIDRYGNTGACSIPIALGEFLHANPIDTGENLLLVAFGGGLTWGATGAALGRHRSRQAGTAREDARQGYARNDGVNNPLLLADPFPRNAQCPTAASQQRNHGHNGQKGDQVIQRSSRRTSTLFRFFS